MCYIYYKCVNVYIHAQNEILLNLKKEWACQVVLVVRNLPAGAGDPRDMGLIPG